MLISSLSTSGRFPHPFWSWFSQDGSTIKMSETVLHRRFRVLKHKAGALQDAWSQMSLIPQDHPQAQRLTRRTHKTLRKALRLMVWLITTEGYQLKSAKGESAWGNVQEKQGTSSQMSPPSNITQMCLIFLATICNNVCKALSLRDAHPSPSVQGAYWGESQKTCSTCMKDLKLLRLQPLQQK